jgi:hypothetical protein
MEDEDTTASTVGIHPVPHDPDELKRVPELLAKIPEFREKLKVLELEAYDLSAKICKEGRGLGLSDVQGLIYRAFYRPLQNRPFQAPTPEELAELRDGGSGVIPNRNLSCEICGENRSTDRCHILPRRLGGTWDSGNLLILCPTHHRLFDRFMLSRAEYALIDWERKLESAQEYANSVTLSAHQEFWRSIADGQYSYIGQYHEAGSSFPFIRHASNKVLQLFTNSKPLKRSNVYRVVDPEVREVAKVAVKVAVKVFIQHSVLREEKKGSVSFLYKEHEGVDVEESIYRRIWQHFS